MNNSITDELKPQEQKVWRGAYRNIGYKVALHSIGEQYTPNGEGIWCFYIYLSENKVKNFLSIWLEDKIVKFAPESKGYVTHEYWVESLKSLYFHGGITFYQKHGHTEGYRYVELGCDYNHLCDQERYGGYNLEEVLWDVKKCIDSVYESGMMVEENK